MIAIVITSCVSSGVSIKIDSGLATIIGAVFGFGALTIQSFMSLRSINISHEMQTERDREAREAQRQSELQIFYRRLQEDRAALAFALVGGVVRRLQHVQ